MNSGMNAEGGANTSASLLGERYRLLRELSRQTYLAEDLSRGQKYCVIKALVPSVKDQATLDQARALLKPAVGTVEQLKHRQVAGAGQLLQINTSQDNKGAHTNSTDNDTNNTTDNTNTRANGGGYLFFVRDYVEGKTYQQLLQERQQFGSFSEVEITQLLYQLLPVLSHIHSLGITHGDIAPDNIVLRQSDGKPVLIDFGSVKAAAMQVRNQLSIGGSGTTTTQIGKVGYMPPEQFASGQVEMTSDLYGLAATLLVLGTGKDPQDLHDTAHGSWTGFETFSPKLGAILTKMLEVYPSDRYPTADTVLAALRSGQSADSRAGMSLERGGRFSTDTSSTDQSPTDPTVRQPADLAADSASENTAFVSNMFSVDSFASSEFASSETSDDIAVNGNAIYPPVDTETELAPEDTAVIPAEISVEGFTDDVIDQNTAVYDSESYSETGDVMPMVAADMTDSGNKPISSTYETTLAESQVHEPAMADEVVEKRDSRQAILPLLVLLGVFATFLGLAWMNSVFSSRRSLAGVGAGDRLTAENVVDWEGPYSREETARRAEIRTRRESIGLGENTFDRLVDQVFYEEYPTLKTSGSGGGRKALTEAPEDEPLRLRWDNIALNLLDTFEGNLSRRSLAKLGEYSESDRTRWQSQVNQVDVSTEALYDLVDAKFLSLFPGQNSADFLRLPVGQLYYAIAEDKAQAIAEGAARENITFAEDTYRTDIANRIGPGNGRVYTLSLTAGQLLRLSLNAEPGDSTLLSVYPPTPTDDNPAIIEDSEQATWSGEVSQSGVYEITVINQANETIGYELAIAADNISTNPPTAPENKEEESAADSDEERPEEDLPPIPGDSSESETSSEDAATAE
ncbi:MAG: serine/threonine-protein kinase [Cyanobacteria bacterium J06621_11]